VGKGNLCCAGEAGARNAMTYSVFVYGTLKRGRSNHASYLGDSRFIGEAHTSKPFMMFGHGFPLARLPIPKDNTWFAGKVKGEIFEVSMDTIRRLDSLEGHPNFYKRTITKLDEFPKSKVWMYHWNDSEGRIAGSICTPKTERFGKDKVHDW